MPNTHYEGRKHIMYVIEFINLNDQKKRIKFSNPQKAGAFYNQVKSSRTAKRVKKTKVYLSGEQQRQEMEEKNQRMQAKNNG